MGPHPREGQAIPEELVFVIAEHMRSNGHKQAAIIVETCMDLYLRQGEWTQIQVGDVAYDGQKLAIILGVAERGERVKTGRNQAVTMDSTILTGVVGPYLRSVIVREGVQDLHN